MADAGGEVSLGSVGVLSVLEDPNERTFLTLADLERLCLAAGQISFFCSTALPVVSMSSPPLTAETAGEAWRGPPTLPWLRNWPTSQAMGPLSDVCGNELHEFESGWAHKAKIDKERRACDSCDFVGFKRNCGGALESSGEASSGAPARPPDTANHGHSSARAVPARWTSLRCAVGREHDAMCELLAHVSRRRRRLAATWWTISCLAVIGLELVKSLASMALSIPGCAIFLDRAVVT